MDRSILKACRPKKPQHLFPRFCATLNTSLSGVEKKISDLENEYADILLRIHRNTLVAKKCIRGLEKTSDGRHFLKLEACEIRPQVSRRNLAVVRKLIRELA